MKEVQYSKKWKLRIFRIYERYKFVDSRSSMNLNRIILNTEKKWLSTQLTFRNNEMILIGKSK